MSTILQRIGSRVALVGPGSRFRSAVPWLCGAGTVLGIEIGFYGTKGALVAAAMVVAGGCFVAGNVMDRRLGYLKGLLAWLACSVVGAGAFISSWMVLGVGGVEGSLTLLGLVAGVWAVNAYLHLGRAEQI